MNTTIDRSKKRRHIVLFIALVEKIFESAVLLAESDDGGEGM